MHLDDMHLFCQIKEGDKRAFRELLQKYSMILLLMAVRKLEDEVEAKEVVNQVFIDLWRHRRRLQLTGTVKQQLYHAVEHGCQERIDRALASYGKSRRTLTAAYTLSLRTLVPLSVKQKFGL